MKYSLILAVFFVITFRIALDAEDDHAFKFTPYFKAATGTELGVDQSYSTLGLVTCYPIQCCSQLQLYNDICWHHFLKGENAFSIDTGLEWGDCDYSFGGYLGYDYRRHHGCAFDQISFGLQMEYCCWLVAFNLNTPLRNEATLCFSTFNYSGGFRAILKEFEAAYRIISLTIGRSFCSCLPGTEIAIGIEPYFLLTESKNLCGRKQKGAGGKARFLFNMCNGLNVEASISHDNIFQSRAQIILEIDLLQLFCQDSTNCCLLNKTFSRQKIIALKRRESWCHNW